ncbi:MAG: hypothetical protein GY841_23960 [FCB group bacterium]|nr:hypothetical protein [FCB group bacterium]
MILVVDTVKNNFFGVAFFIFTSIICAINIEDGSKKGLNKGAGNEQS